METPNHDRAQQVSQALDIIRPYVRGDGGDIEVVDISSDGVVSLRLVGNCVGCGSASITVNEGILGVLQGQLPWVRAVVQIEEDDPVASSAVDATATLESEHRFAEEQMSALENALAETQAGSPLPNIVKSWIDYSHSQLRRHFEIEETCVFPVIEMFLDAMTTPVNALKRDHTQYWDLLAVFEQALGAYENSLNKERLASVVESARAMLRHLAAHFMREQGGLYAMAEQGLPDDLKREIRGDILNARSRQLGAYKCVAVA